MFCHYFFFNDTATTEIYTLSLHDALPIWIGRIFSFSASSPLRFNAEGLTKRSAVGFLLRSLIMFQTDRKSGSAGMPRPISYAVFCLKKKKQSQFSVLPTATADGK